jgi:hypothetical protein
MRKFRHRPAIINNDPIIRFLFEEMYRQRVCQMDLSERVGLHRDTLRKWRTQHSPRLPEIQAALNALGYELKILPVKDA